MVYGRRPDGFLPVFSVGSEREAKNLLVLACPRNNAGEFVAPELVEEQNPANLDRFSERLDKAHAILQANGDCDCRR